MPVRIRVRDFQSVKDAEVVVDKFTVVTGSNNSGKTATNRAVTGVFSNPPGDVYVRHGAEKFSVEVKFEDGQSVKWEKGPKVKPTYTVNGKVIHPGRAVPEEVLALGVRPIQAGGGVVWPQVAAQFTGTVFLLDLPGSAIAEAVADVDRVGKLTQALRLADADKRSATSDLRVRRQDVEAAKREVAVFEGLDLVGGRVAAAEQAYADVCSTEATLKEVVGLRERLEVATGALVQFDGFVPGCVPDDDSIQKARKCRKSLSVAVGLQDRLRDARKQVASLSGIRDVEVPASFVAVRELLLQVQAWEGLKRDLDIAREVAALVEGTDLLEIKRELGGVGERVKKAEHVKKGLSAVLGYQERLRAFRGEIKALREQLRVKQDALKGAEDEVSTTLGGLGECPVCKTPSAGRKHIHKGP